MTRAVHAAFAVILGLLFTATGASMAHGLAKTSVPLAVPAIRRRAH